MPTIIVSDARLQATKQYIHRTGRLLERRLFGHFFGETSRAACVRALRAYQNDDGGFGNGIEPDLLCPDSSGIGAETAMWVMDLLQYHEPDILDPLLGWIEDNLAEDGPIQHAPGVVLDYPHQPWWEGPDPTRILAIAGYLGKWGIEHPALSRSARASFARTAIPEAGSYYGYPHFVYLKHCLATADDETRLASMVDQLPAVLDQHADHFPLFSRAWYHAIDVLPREAVEREARIFAAAMQDDGGLDAPYPDLPWWRPIWTLDGLILLRRHGLL